MHNENGERDHEFFLSGESPKDLLAAKWRGFEKA